MKPRRRCPAFLLRACGLDPALGHKRLDGFANEDPQRLKACLRAKAPKTANNVLAVLSVLLKKAVEWNVIEQMPCPRAIDSRTYLIVLLGGEAGLRCGEMIALERADVDLYRGQLIVQRSDWNSQVTSPKGDVLATCT